MIVDGRVRARVAEAGRLVSRSDTVRSWLANTRISDRLGKAYLRRFWDG